MTSEPSSPPPLPSRPPRSLFVHWAVDSAVAFLALLVLGLILGASILVIAVIAVVVGLAVAPSTRRAECARSPSGSKGRRTNDRAGRA